MLLSTCFTYRLDYNYKYWDEFARIRDSERAKLNPGVLRACAIGHDEKQTTPARTNTGYAMPSTSRQPVRDVTTSMSNTAENSNKQGPGKRVRIRDLRKLVMSDPVNPAKCLQSTSTAASQLVLADMSNDARLKRLSKLREVVRVLKPHLSDQAAGPLTSSQAGGVPFYDECGRMYSKLADVAVGVLLSTMESKSLSRRQSHQAVQSGYWAMEFLAERLRCAYGAYVRVPIGTWSDIHRVYRSLTSRKLERERVKDSGGTTPVSIEHVYKRLIVFGLSDPYQLAFHGVEKVFKSLGEWVSMVQIGQRASQKGCQFEIKLDADYPAMPVLGSNKTGEVDPVIYLDTSRLVMFLNENLIEMHTATQNLSTGQRKISEELQFEEILKRLIVKLGIQPYRKSGRTLEERACHAVVGLHSIVDLVGASGSPGTEVHDGAGIRSVELVDESEFGARLRIRENGGQQMSIGEVVAISYEDGAWSVGMVRWVQVDENKQVYVGIHRFLDNYIPVRVRPLASLDEMPFAPPVIPGLWTVREKKGRKITSLVITAATYKPKQTVVVSRDKIEHALEMRDAILSTDYVVWCDVSLEGSNPQRTVELLHPHFV